MSREIRPAPIRRSIVVGAPPDFAFEVFAERMGSWWPATHHIGAAPPRDVVVEPRPGGRWYEIGEDGAQCDWGRVLAWEPPSRILLAWHVNANFEFDANLNSTVEIRFTAEQGGTKTRVDLKHDLEGFAADAEKARETLDSPNGWGRVLSLFGEHVHRSDHSSKEGA